MAYVTPEAAKKQQMSRGKKPEHVQLHVPTLCCRQILVLRSLTRTELQAESLDQREEVVAWYTLYFQGQSLVQF